MTTWRSAEDEPPPPRPRGAGWLRVALRGAAVGGVTFGGLALLLLVRLVERPLFGLHRPWSPRVTQAVCRAALWLLGLRVSFAGRPLARPGAMVANHASWLDIFALNAAARLYFVAKAEVADWPGIGWLARATGTVFITRRGGDALAQTALFIARLRAGHRLLFFPEGTSTDGLRVLPFKPTLFAAFFEPALREGMHIQPVSVTYAAPAGTDRRFYGWWGAMGFNPHLLAVLAQARQGAVRVTFHAPLRVADFADRKALSAAAEAAVRAGHAAP